MIPDVSERRATSSSEPCVDSDLVELPSELESTLMAPNEAGLESGEDESDGRRDGEARGGKCGRARGTTRYGCTRQPIDIHGKAEVLRVYAWPVVEEEGSD